MTLNLTRQIQANYQHLAAISAHVEKKKAEEQSKSTKVPSKGA